MVPITKGTGSGFGSLGFCVTKPYMVVLRLGKIAVAFDIKVETLKQG
jgi:hypothetical protein